MHYFFVTPISLSGAAFIPELFLSISVLFLTCYGLFSYNLKLPLIQEPTINLALLVLILSLFLFLNLAHFYDVLKLLPDSPWFIYHLPPKRSLDNTFFIDEFFWKDERGISYIRNLIYSFKGGWSSLFNSYLLDNFSYFFKVVILVSSIVCLVMFQEFVSTSKINFFEYSVIILLCLVGSLIICSANDFLTVYVAIELQSLALYVLAAFKRKSFSSIESGLKYFVLGAFSSGFFLFGISLLYGLLGTLNFDDIALLTADKNNVYSNVSLSYSYAYVFDYRNEFHNFSNDLGGAMGKIILFILLSLLFKLALAPFHAWSPDIYENSPTSSSFFFSVVTKLSILALFLKLYCIYFSFINYNWKYIITVVGLVSVLIGSIGGVEQRKIKTLLAYSSISHLGYIALSSSCDSPVSFQMSIGYITLYVLSGVSVWSLFFFVNIKKNSGLNKHNKDLGDLSLLKKSNIVLSICFAAYLFSIAGIPPLAGFLAKVNVFLTLLHHESMVVISLLSLVGSVISTFLYIRVIKIIFFESVLVGRLYLPIRNNTPVLLAILFILPFLIFIIPTSFYCITEKYTAFTAQPINKQFFTQNLGSGVHPILDQTPPGMVSYHFFGHDHLTLEREYKAAGTGLFTELYSPSSLHHLPAKGPELPCISCKEESVTVQQPTDAMEETPSERTPSTGVTKKKLRELDPVTRTMFFLSEKDKENPDCAMISKYFDAFMDRQGAKEGTEEPSENPVTVQQPADVIEAAPSERTPSTGVTKKKLWRLDPEKRAMFFRSDKEHPECAKIKKYIDALMDRDRAKEGTEDSMMEKASAKKGTGDFYEKNRNMGVGGKEGVIKNHNPSMENNSKSLGNSNSVVEQLREKNRVADQLEEVKREKDREFYKNREAKPIPNKYAPPVSKNKFASIAKFPPGGAYSPNTSSDFRPAPSQKPQ